MGIELNPSMKEFLKDKPYTTMTGVDFLEFARSENVRHLFDRIVMNPPFSKQQDIDHIIAAFDFLSPGGILVSIMSESPFFRTNKKSLDFMAFLREHNAEIEQLPEGAFKESGTMVRTRIIKIKKTA
jgi:predicted RNA methylase